MLKQRKFSLQMKRCRSTGRGRRTILFKRSPKNAISFRKEEYRPSVENLAALVEALREGIAAERGQTVEITADGVSIGQTDADGEVSA